jgi:hypothetical protein
MADASGRSVTMDWADTGGCHSAAQYCTYFLTSPYHDFASKVPAALRAEITTI